MAEIPENRLLRIIQITGDDKARPPVVGLVPVGRTTLLDWVKQGKFPRPVKIGGCVMWRYRDVMQWIEQDGRWSASNHNQKGEV